VIYDADGVEASDGPRPLAARAYYARLTQALVTAVTAPMANGRLYEVDMRLRPSGRQGPVATSLAAFRDYQHTEAWTWEHLALTRARTIAGNRDLGAAVEDIRREVLATKGAEARVRPDVADMRARLLAHKPGGGWEPKAGPGRLMDIELLAQTCALVAGDPARRTEAQLRAGVRAGVIGKDDEAALVKALRLLWQVQAAARLLSVAVPDPSRMGQGAQDFVLRECGADNAQTLGDRIQALADRAERIISATLAGQ